MKMMIIAGLVITLPALLIAVLFAGSRLMWPALASFLINSLPFLVAGWMIRKNKGDDDLSH